MQQTYKDETKSGGPPPYYHETMMFHTTARNVGLYTSLSLAALGAARALLARNREGTAAALGACAVLFLVLAMELNQALLWPTPREEEANMSRRVPWVLAVAHALMCLAMGVAAWRGVAAFRRQ